MIKFIIKLLYRLKCLFIMDLGQEIKSHHITKHCITLYSFYNSEYVNYLKEVNYLLFIFI
jgi:hypothetical protein